MNEDSFLNIIEHIEDKETLVSFCTSSEQFKEYCDSHRGTLNKKFLSFDYDIPSLEIYRKEEGMTWTEVYESTYVYVLYTQIDEHYTTGDFPLTFYSVEKTEEDAICLAKRSLISSGFGHDIRMDGKDGMGYVGIKHPYSIKSVMGTDGGEATVDGVDRDDHYKSYEIQKHKNIKMIDLFGTKKTISDFFNEERRVYRRSEEILEESGFK